METYRFELAGGIGRGMAPIDLQMDSLSETRHEAVLFLAQMLRDHVDDFWSMGEVSVTVKDSAGLILFVLDVTTLYAPAMPPLN